MDSLRGEYLHLNLLFAQSYLNVKCNFFKNAVFFLDGKVANLVYIITGVACARIGHYLRNFGFPTGVTSVAFS